MNSLNSLPAGDHVRIHRRNFLKGLPIYAAVSTGLIVTFDRLANLVPGLQEGKSGEAIRKIGDGGLAALASMGAINSGICAEKLDKVDASKNNNEETHSPPYSYLSPRIVLAEDGPIAYSYKRGTRPA